MIIKITERDYEGLVKDVDRWIKGYKNEDGDEIYTYDLVDDILMTLGIEVEK
jgi:hypothetical protein